MEDRLKKVGIVLAVILAAVLAVLIYQDNRQKVERSTQLERYLEETEPVSTEIKKLTEQRENLDEEYKEKIQGKTGVILCFMQMDAEVFNDVFPLLGEYGYSGVFVMESPDVLGAENQLALEQYEEMLASGWQPVTSEEKGQIVEMLSIEEVTIQEADSEVQSKVKDSLPQEKTVLVTAEYVGQDIQDTAADCSVDKYRRLLEWLKETEEDVDIRTLESERIYREQLAQTSGMYQEEKDGKVREINKRIEELEQKIQEAKESKK